MTEVKLCQKDGAELFHTVETAKYVETIETIIFYPNTLRSSGSLAALLYY